MAEPKALKGVSQLFRASLKVIGRPLKKLLKKNIKFLGGFLVVFGAFLYLFLNTFRSSLQYYLTVSELKAFEQTYQHKILKIAGIARSVQKEERFGSTVYRFQVIEGGQQIPVVYKGFVPDTFKEGAEVVVTGSLSEEGIFIATEILAKCASKYQAKVKNS